MTVLTHSFAWLAAATLATASLSLAAGAAVAQTPPAGATKPASNPATKPAAKPAPKPAAKPAAKPVPRTAAVPALPAADSEQLAAAEVAHLGTYECEFNQTVVVSKHPRSEGYIDVQHKASTWTMKPVLSSTGALRLEDVRGRTLMLQIANKSMLMDTKVGQRLVDACVHDKQRAFAAQPPAQSLGIAPPAAGAASAPAPAPAPAPTPAPAPGR
jgi:hypothetical protein